MKQYLILFLAAAGALIMTSCAKSTNSDEYASVWTPYSATDWGTTPSGIGFTNLNGGFSFNATITPANAVDTLGVSLTVSPKIYIISNFETASDAKLSLSAAISSAPDSMRLQTIVIDPVTHDTTRYAHFQFGRVHGTVQTAGIDSVLTQPRLFGEGGVFTYAPSVHPDSCSHLLTLKVIVNWNNYTGAAVLDTLKTTKVTVSVNNMSLTVNGVDILK